MSAATVTMSGVAAFRGVHYDTVRKGWETWVLTEGFPAPVTERPLRWAQDSLDAWSERRQAANRERILAEARRREGHTTISDAPANQNHPDPAPTARRVDRERGAVLALMAAARRQGA